MFLFDTKLQKKKRRTKSRSASSIEAKAAAKANKIKQDDMDALQITFYEIESWIEKTTPVLSRMTKELDKASRHFDNGSSNKRKKHDIPTDTYISPNSSLVSTLSSMEWGLSIQPNNSIRLDTNIKSIEQLVEAVQKMRLMTEFSHTDDLNSDDELEDTSSTSSVVDPSIEYWKHAMYRRPHTCLEKYKHCDMNLSHLTEDVSPSVLRYICQTYWNCLHPKLSQDWPTFWHQFNSPDCDQACIDSELAMIFLHVIRHDRNACANAHTIAYYYYDRAREALCFDEPNITTIKTLLYLSLFCVLCKRDSQSRIYLTLAYRMIHQLGLGTMSQMPTDEVQRKELFDIHMVLYYNDVTVSLYSGEPCLIDDSACNIDFYQLLDEDTTQDQKVFYVHLVELARIGKRIQALVNDYQQQNLQHHHSGKLPFRWIKKVQTLELSLAAWFDRLPSIYRTGDTHASLLLMMQYQTQWLTLHKTFLSPNHPHNIASDLAGLSPLNTTPYRTGRSLIICIDAAKRIVMMAEAITQKYDWCVCQHFISCVYQASTVFCKSVINKDKNSALGNLMIQRIMSVLATSKVNYQGLPADLTACLDEFLADKHVTSSSNIDDVQLDDTMFNSPKMYKQCLNQQVAVKPSTLMMRDPPSEAMLSIKIQNPGLDLEPANSRSWRCQFSSFNVAHVDHRVM